MAANLSVFEDKMKKTISVLESEMKAVRAGRANPAILDKVTVEYYGAPSPGRYYSWRYRKGNS